MFCNEKMYCLFQRWDLALPWSSDEVQMHVAVRKNIFRICAQKLLP
jgi:hypothetical protein